MRIFYFLLAFIFASAALALPLPLNNTMLNYSSWNLKNATVDMDFVNGRYFGFKPSQLTVSRASQDWEVCNGQLSTFANNVAAITPGCGMWIWPSRTNSIRNSTMVGAVAGTPGTLPTDWTVSVPEGLTTNVVATSTINGFSVVDIQVTGTPTGTVYALLTVPNILVAETYGQTWTVSGYYALVGGSLTNISSISHRIRTYTAGGANLDAGPGTDFKGSLTSILTRFSESLTPTSTTNAYTTDQLLIGTTVGQAINVTLRIAVPQLELNSDLYATVASATTAASGTGGTNGTAVYTVSGGTCTTQPTLNVTWTTGTLAINSVANAGSCSVLPPSPATLTYLSGTATGWTSATVNLVPTDNSSKAFATGPILTSTVAVTRQTSTTTVSAASPFPVTGATTFSALMSVGQNYGYLESVARSGGATTVGYFRNTSGMSWYTDALNDIIVSGNSGGNASQTVTWSAAPWPSTVAMTYGSSTAVATNGVVSSVVTGTPTAIGNTWYIGSVGGAISGPIRRLVVWPNKQFTASQLQFLSSGKY